MSKSDSMFIAFQFGGTIPGSVLGGKDRKVGPHEAVKVPRDYGDSLVADRFAYETDPSTAKARTARPQEAGDLAEREAAVKKAWSEITSRDSALKEREIELSNREADLVDRETAVTNAHAELAQREQAVAKAEADLFAPDAAAKKTPGNQSGGGNG